jgi:hypothetical protein
MYRESCIVDETDVDGELDKKSNLAVKRLL